MKTVCLSAGHYTLDPGAVSGSLIERDLVALITNYAAIMLRKHGIPTLEVPNDLNLIATIAWINDRSSQIDLACEIHINAGGGTGIETWYYYNDGTSKKLAEFINDACVAETGLANRGVKDEVNSPPGRLGFIHDTLPLAVLVECGFIDGDSSYFTKDENLFTFAKGVARGILSYIGVTWNPNLIYPQVQPSPPPNPSPAGEDLQKYKNAAIEIKGIFTKYNL